MLYRTNEAIVWKFALRNTTTGALVTTGTFTAIARDAAGGDISSQIVPVADGTVAGVFTYSFTPTLEGTYFVSVYESTTNQHFDALFKVGGSLEDRIWNLANQGQSIALGSGGGDITYNGTLSQNGSPVPSAPIRVYAAQDPASTGADPAAVVDIQTVIAQTTSDASGHFTLTLNSGYYALQYATGNLWATSYIRWSGRLQNWVVSTSPITPAQL